MEEPHTTSQTLQQDREPLSLTKAMPEEGSCTGITHMTGKKIDVKRDEQQLEPENDVTNPESRVDDPDFRKTSRTGRPTVRYG